MKRIPCLLLPSLLFAVVLTPATAIAQGHGEPDRDDAAVRNGAAAIRRGRQVFRFDTFGSEAFWGSVLRLHETIRELPPTAALSVGLKVDVDALPGSLRSDLRHGRVPLTDPSVTLDLLRRDAVVGVRGFFDAGNRLQSVGIQCALCHSTVDDALAPGIGARRDGWPNRDLDVGAILSLAPDLSAFQNLLGVDRPTVQRVLRSWGPGRFDAHLLLDGRAARPDGGTGAVLLPAAFGLAGVNLTTYEGWGGIAHWNAFVANLEMGGRGTLFDPRLDDPIRFPIAAANRSGHVRAADDRITAQLADLQLYQLALPVPTPPAASFDRVAAARGELLFRGSARCAECHVPPLYTEPGFNAHTPAEIGIDGFQAGRGPLGRYRTTPLRGLFTRSRGGFYHDGRFADLGAVVDHYDTLFGLRLSTSERSDLVQFLRSL